MKVDNAIIMAAGMSTRFVPLSFETHKAMVKVNGEVLIERQIRQLIEKGVKEIYIVTGYMKEQFDYLKDKFNVKLIHNKEYNVRNNNSSIWAVRDILSNSYVCSSDNYFTINPFDADVTDSYYAALFSEGETNEWCISEDENGYINSVVIGGKNSWYMMGHTFWNKDFSSKFIDILYKEYDLKETINKLWEAIYLDHLDVLKMKIKKYNGSDIYEFDTLDDLRLFDNTYVNDTRSIVLKQVSKDLNIFESNMNSFKPVFDVNNKLVGFNFKVNTELYNYDYVNKVLKKGSK